MRVGSISVACIAWTVVIMGIRLSRSSRVESRETTSSSASDHLDCLSLCTSGISVLNYKSLVWKRGSIQEMKAIYPMLNLLPAGSSGLHLYDSCKTPPKYQSIKCSQSIKICLFSEIFRKLVRKILAFSGSLTRFLQIIRVDREKCRKIAKSAQKSASIQPIF